MKALKIGNEVKIEYLNGEEKVSSILSKVTNIEYDRLELSAPETNYEEACKYLNEGTTILVYIYTSNGIRAFDSIVLNPLSEKLIIDFPNDYKNIQRRKYIRANWISQAILIDPKTNESFNITTKDLGGEALKFITNNFIDLNEKYKISLTLDNFLPSIVIEGRIEKKEHFSDKEYLFFYEDIKDSDRNKIIKKCLELEVCEMWDK